MQDALLVGVVNMSEIKYKRILLKLSGEALAGQRGFGLDYSVMRTVCKSIRDCAAMGVQIGIVVGGGNFWRGRSSGAMDRTRADHIGMLATTMNALAVADVLEEMGLRSVCRRRLLCSNLQNHISATVRSAIWRKAVWSFSAVGLEIRSSRPTQRLRCVLLKLTQTLFLRRLW